MLHQEGDHCDEEEEHRAEEVKLLSHAFISSGYYPRMLKFLLTGMPESNKHTVICGMAISVHGHLSCNVIWKCGPGWREKIP